MTRYRFILTLALLFALQLAVIGAFVLVAGSDLAPGQRAALLAGMSLLLLLALGLGLKALFDAYLVPLARLGEEIALLPANPAHRLAPQGARELRALAAALNGVAAAHQALRDEGQARNARDNHALAEERNRLAVLMSELAVGVLVCSQDGRILLYNRRARQLLEGGRNTGGVDAASVGLGRSLFGILEHGALTQALERMRRQLRRQADATGSQVRQPDEAAGFVAPLAGGGVVHARIAPVLDELGTLDGFVLVFDDVSQDASAGSSHGLATHGLPVWKGRPVFYDFDLFRQTGADADLGARPLAKISYAVFDTETTGLHPAAGDEIVAIGAVRIVNGRLLPQESFDRLIRPRCPLSAEAVAIHGLTEGMLAGQPRVEQVLPQFQRFVEDTVLVGHNVAFDLRFLQMQEDPTGVRLRQPVLDTLLLSQVIHPHQAEHALEAVAARLGVRVAGRHSALGDAIATAEVFLRMLPLLAEKGIRTLDEARNAERQTLYARLRY